MTVGSSQINEQITTILQVPPDQLPLEISSKQK